MGNMTVSSSDKTVGMINPAIITPAVDFTATEISQEAAPLRVRPPSGQPDVILDKPQVPQVNMRKLRDLVGSFKEMEMDLTVEILLLLLKLALEERKNSTALRNIQQDAVITALESQVKEMKTASRLMIAMTAVSAATTLVSFTGGLYGVVRGAHVKFDGLSRKDQFVRGKEFDGIQMKANLCGTTTQGVSQMSQNGISIKKNDVDAAAKEDDTDANVAEKQYQHASEQAAYCQGLMGDVRDLVKQMTSNHAQAYSAAASV